MQRIGMEFVNLFVLLVQICPRICGYVPYYYGPCNKVGILIIFSIFHSLCHWILYFRYGANEGDENKQENT